ncbi:MAG: hypothetical protein MPJ50_19570, partial [Pirellulales bacterium]|nr:hypothetical protein [Pirellulales bacterium]
AGCSAHRGIVDHVHYSDGHDDFMVGWKNRIGAWQAWKCAKPNYLDHPQLKAFGDGFRAGYRDVASGGNGCPPPVPPRYYWNWKYQNPEGQAAVAAWFDGYPQGAVAADMEGVGNFRQIQVSHAIREQYSQRRHGEPPTHVELIPQGPQNDLPPVHPSDSFPAPPAVGVPGTIDGAGQVNPRELLGEPNFAWALGNSTMPGMFKQASEPELAYAEVSSFDNGTASSQPVPASTSQRFPPPGANRDWWR